MAYSQTKFLFLSLFWLSFSNLSQAQIVPDKTLPQHSTIDSNCSTSCQIEGGTVRDSNLFHSFEQFSVPTNGKAVFNNGTRIENIFTRVTGDSISNIDGLIRAQGSANLFLINPNGIIFGENAGLHIGGSFLATTAESILFEDDSQFSATNPQSSSLLTVSVPIGLQFGATAGAIVNKSQLTEELIPGVPETKITRGLKVKDGETLSLVASDIKLDGGSLTALKGRIELGSVAPNSFVNLTQNAEGLILRYDSVNQFANIFFINSSELSVESPIYSPNLPSGTIQIYGSLIEVDNSRILSFNESKFDGREIVINAENLILQDSQLDTQTLAEGKAGNIIINTNRLAVQNRAQVTVSTVGSGDGGNLTINASESIEVIGRNSDKKFSSGLFAQSLDGKATGDAGNLTVNTGRLIVRDGGRISVGATESLDPINPGISQGNGGNLEINATESIEVSGSGLDEQRNNVPSTLLSESQGSGNAGNLDIITPKLTVANGGEINVSATGTGEAGSLDIESQEVNLDNGSLTAETRRGDEGNITLSNLDTLLLRNNSEITTNASEQATGGDIKISSDVIALLDESDITANAVEGEGGNIIITTEGIFQTPNSDIEAISKRGIDGTITINSPDVDPTSGIIELPGVPINAEAILADNLCKFEDDKIAEGSSFIITGRGGLTPTAENSLDNVDDVVRWADREKREVSQNGIVAVRQRSHDEVLETNYSPVQQSQGWVKTTDGSVWLVANAPEIMPQNSQMVNPDCKASR